MAEKKPAAKSYVHVVMAIHPVHKKPIPIATHDDEETAWKVAADRNKTHSHLAHHVKKVPKQS